MAMDPRTYERGLACVHCGLCLPACPTYVETGHEADSPRGRIQLMLGLAEGKIQASPVVRKHLDLCLDCRGCETACPSGVVYHELIEETRSRLASSQTPTLQGRVMQWLFFNVFIHPTRLKLALLPARILQKTGLYSLLRKSGLFNLLPSQLRKMEQMLPPTGPLWPTQPALIQHSAFSIQRSSLNPEPRTLNPSPQHSAPSTQHSISVGFFPGCIGSVLYDKVNQQAVELLAAGGANVQIPSLQGCCGAIHHHNGHHEPAREMAKRNIDAFCPKEGPGVDFIVTNIAGCGAMLREYDHLLRDDPLYAQRAREFSSRVRDISEMLVQLPLPPARLPINQTATYHGACHLAHAQKVVSAPRQLLSRIAGLTLVPLPENDMCCGAAGTYNLTQPEMSSRLAERKLANILSTGASICLTGNVGCAMQIQSEAAARGINLKVLHPVELLHQAITASREKQF